jgi:hypothetical protein
MKALQNRKPVEPAAPMLAEGVNQDVLGIVVGRKSGASANNSHLSCFGRKFIQMLPLSQS